MKEKREAPIARIKNETILSAGVLQEKKLLLNFGWIFFICLPIVLLCHVGLSILNDYGYQASQEYTEKLPLVQFSEINRFLSFINASIEMVILFR